jgi:hypothetical protein
MFRHPTQPLLTHNRQSRKTESLHTQKLAPKLFAKMTDGFLSAQAPVDSEKVKEN